MVSYVVTGASRGLGLAFVQALHNSIFAIVQDLNSCGELEKIAGPDIHIIPGDLDKPKSLHSAAAEVSRITGGSLDVFINNAAMIPSIERGGYTLTNYIGKDDLLVQDFTNFFRTNVLGAVAVTNAFLPLIEKGTQRKVVNISSAAGDSEFVEKAGYVTGVPYGISKAALNHINTKYAVEFRGKGYTFLAISPGLVDTRPPPRTDVEKAARDALITTFKTGYPDWNGIPMLPKQAAELVLDVIDRATPKDSGRFLSQYGDRRWL